MGLPVAVVGTGAAQVVWTVGGNVVAGGFLVVGFLV